MAKLKSRLGKQISKGTDPVSTAGEGHGVLVSLAPFSSANFAHRHLRFVHPEALKPQDAGRVGKRTTVNQKSSIAWTIFWKASRSTGLVT